MDSIPDMELFERNERALIERLGLPLFVIKWLGKTPATKHGFKNATKNIAEYRRLHGGRPHNIGLATGGLSGIWVLDIDPRHGGQESYQQMIREHGALPMTWEVKTQSGGLHIYFRWDERRPVSNKVNILPGIDVRGEGGYVLLPPSRVEGTYEWVVSPSQVMLAEAPNWLYEVIGADRHLGKKDLSHLTQGVSEGARNVSLTQLIGMLLGKNVDVQLAWLLADGYNRCHVHPPVDDNELLKTFESIANREIRKRQDRARRLGA